MSMPCHPFLDGYSRSGLGSDRPHSPGSVKALPKALFRPTDGAGAMAKLCLRIVKEPSCLSVVGDLQENKIPIFEREGWQSQPSLSKIGILLIRRSLGTFLVQSD